MTAIPDIPIILVLCVATLLLSGFVVLIWGRKLPQQGSWLVLGGMLVLVAGLALSWSNLHFDRLEPQAWLKGWVWPHNEVGAISVGILQDPLGLAMAFLVTMVSIVTFLNQSLLSQAQAGRPDRFYAAVALTAGGVALAWIALTPWLAFVGLAAAIFGGFIAQGFNWNHDDEANLAVRFGRERVWGLLLAILGACLLAAPRASLIWGNGASWGQGSGSASTDVIGASLLMLGLFIQQQPFPFLGWIVSRSMLLSPVRIVLAQTFPAWAAFAILIRIEPQLKSFGIFPVFGWIELASAVLAVGSGLFQSEWPLGIGTWVSASASIAAAVLAFSGPWAAMAFLVGASLAGIALSFALTALAEGGAATPQSRKQALWLKAACVLAAASGTGMLGFIAASGGVRWIAEAWDQPVLAAAVVFVIFIQSLLAWKLVWMALRSKSVSGANWLSVLSPYLFVLFSLALIWTGSASGETLFNELDRLFPSLLSSFFGSGSPVRSDASAMAAAWVYWATFAAGIAASYWTSGRREDLWQKLSGPLPRVSDLLTKGYRLDEASSAAIRGVEWIGNSTVWIVDQKIWNDWLPSALVIGIRRTAVPFAEANAVMSRRLGEILRRWIEVPSQLLQLVQSGNVQWYLLFAIGSGIAILIHYLKF